MCSLLEALLYLCAFHGRVSTLEILEFEEPMVWTELWRLEGNEGMGQIDTILLL